ncbi:hypothetical protein [Nodularia sphaerocarpa]|uniref:hypothetical protein n=1 Tax=Nodularia sphaerocarpa TaxID=137816 RepID=UPI001EFA5632|nr:hypothetical protein [Nodularia sphaerocarpa]MDB9372791.1 hypothetical protein [Nodularia sphaerocarpa CS-585]MDB9376728.1 hypothetical protein [Nodularia sphaerocarpa CS-585A2]ULP74181.1 hypothetical protein BDGGKGIB_03844 [Nodularia sphaerocarpa UHCC 0038]
MVDLTVALAIANIACSKFFESSVGKLGEKFTETGVKKIGDLYTMIRQKLSGNTAANNALAEVEKGKEDALHRVAVYLLDEMQADPDFAQDVKKIADEINIHRVEDNSSQTQNNYGGQNYQTKTGDRNNNTFGNVTQNYYGTPPKD